MVPPSGNHVLGLALTPKTDMEASPWRFRAVICSTSWRRFQLRLAALRERGIVASVAPCAQAHVHLTPSIRNLDAEVDRAVEAVRALV